MFSLTALDVRKLRFELTESLKIPHKFYKDVKRAGRDWLFSFLICNPVLIIQIATVTSIDRVKAFTKQAVVPFIKRFWIHTKL